MFRALSSELASRLILPGDAEYEAARRVWNGLIDRRPAAIARCTGVADVVAAVRCARDHGLVVAVRGGGHSVPGHSTCDGGLVIDLSPMKGLWIDRETRRCRAQAGLTWGEFDRETQLHGLAVTGGQVSTTGIAGLTLGGGIGWLMRKHGLTCDNVVSAEVVTADGDVVTTSATQDPELYWAIRGGGGNFGIVTSFEYQLHPVGPVIFAGTLVYRLDQAREVLRFARDWMQDAPDELSTCGVLLTVPPREPFPAWLHGQRALTFSVCYIGAVEDGERILAPLRAFARPALDLVGPMTYTALQTSLDVTAPRGQNYWERSEYVEQLGDPAIDVIVERFSDPEAPPGEVIVFERGGAVTRVAEDAMAFSHRRAAYLIWIISHWPPGDPRPEWYVQWTRSFSEAIRRFSNGGVYVNGLADEGPSRVISAYGAEKYARLAALKKRYDPTNRFRLNQNIRPAE